MIQGLFYAFPDTLVYMSLFKCYLSGNRIIVVIQQLAFVISYTCPWENGWNWVLILFSHFTSPLLFIRAILLDCSKTHKCQGRRNVTCQLSWVIISNTQAGRKAQTICKDVGEEIAWRIRVSWKHGEWGLELALESPGPGIGWIMVRAVGLWSQDQGLWDSQRLFQGLLSSPQHQGWPWKRSQGNPRVHSMGPVCGVQVKSCPSLIYRKHRAAVSWKLSLKHVFHLWLHYAQNSHMSKAPA